ncbi:MAG: hypothetical protein JWR86_782, partial [Enterovirga sp.]|nr:hypothetical protein [Enterovirga sp.]
MAEDISTETVAPAPLTALEQLVAAITASVPPGVVTRAR